MNMFGDFVRRQPAEQNQTCLDYTFHTETENAIGASKGKYNMSREASPSCCGAKGAMQGAAPHSRCMMALTCCAAARGIVGRFDDDIALVFSFGYYVAMLPFVFFVSHTFTFQLLEKPWLQVSSLLPPGSCLQFLSRIGFSNPTARRFFIECC